MYPILEIDKSIIAGNTRRLVQMCSQHGIEVTAVTKVVMGDAAIASIFVDNGIARIADSRIPNLAKLAGINAEKWLIRTPMISEAPQVVELADVSLNAEISVLHALDDSAKKQSKIHKVILMLDLGDLREGYFRKEELESVAGFVQSSSNLELYGIGANLACLNFALPDTEKMGELLGIASKLGVNLVSAGNSASLDLMLAGGMPSGINNLRLGESLLFGRERARFKYLDGTRNDAFILKAEVIELKEKPSAPWGEIGVDSYGRKAVFVDKGIRKRAILALGKQDTDIETMWPVDPGIEIIGASGDHLIVDVAQACRDVFVGAVMPFRLGYYALLRAYTSPFVNRVYLN
ncbi:MAG: alanine/ornithine racemase family PLP-dependent enzyme [Eubacteriaceae bacterium]|nr:alanine/ornithine racemase family PLP-dependent enzyme [Eubacteriaceae bacterium]